MNLPLEVIEYIAVQDHKVWYILVQCYKFLAEKSFNSSYIDKLKRKFLQRREGYKTFKVAYCLPNGILHNDMKPSIKDINYQIWYQNNKIHRDNDLPAVIHPNGDKEWCQNGNLHRDNDQPAYISASGYQSWYQDGQRHRDHNRPAIIYTGGSQEWYHYGKFIRAS